MNNENKHDDKYAIAEIGNGSDPFYLAKPYYRTPNYNSLFVDNAFKPELGDILICDKYLHNIREDISELVEDTFICIDIDESDKYKLTSLIDTYACDQDMYGKFINSDELKHLEKYANLVLNDIEIKNTIRLYQILKDQRDRIVAKCKGEFE